MSNDPKRGEALNLMWKTVNLDTARDCLWQMEVHGDHAETPEKEDRRKALLQVFQKHLTDECDKAMKEAYAALHEYYNVGGP